MTITSMSGNELYRTLMGRDNPHANFTETVKNDLSTENPNVTGVKAPDRDSFEYSDGIDFMDPYIRSELGEGYANGLPTKERIAEYYGNIAKRLDEAYSQGKFTDKEYKELNDMLNAQVEKEAEMSERRTAFYALGKQRGNLSPAAANEAIIRENSMTSEEFMAEKEKNILEYVENFCKIDRKSLWEMFELIRNGTAPLSMK